MYSRVADAQSALGRQDASEAASEAAYAADLLDSLVAKLEAALADAVAMAGRAPVVCADFARPLPDIGKQVAALRARLTRCRGEAFGSGFRFEVPLERSCQLCLHSRRGGEERLVQVLSGRFHAECANLWMSCVESVIPALTYPSESLF